MSDYDDEHHPLSDKPKSTGAKVYAYLRPVMAELIGTMLFVFIAVVSGATEGIVGIALCHGLSIAIVVTGFGWISGGHFNPAVTLGVFIAGGIKLPFLILYPVAQIVGSFLGAMWASIILDFKTGGSRTAVIDKINAGAHSLGPHVGVGQAIFAEILITMLLVLTVLVVCDKKNPTSIASLAIGLAVVVGILSCGKISGGSMNPARSLGPAIAGSFRPIKGGVWANHYVYWIGPLLGGVLSGVIYKLIFANHNDRWVVKED